MVSYQRAMGRTVNVAEAKAQLSRLLVAAHAGEEIVLAKNGRPYARLVPIEPVKRRPLGFLRMKLPDSFFEPLPEDELAAFEGAFCTPLAPRPRQRSRRARR